MIVYNYDADLEVSDTCVRSSLLSWVELTAVADDAVMPIRAESSSWLSWWGSGVN